MDRVNLQPALGVFMAPSMVTSLNIDRVAGKCNIVPVLILPYCTRFVIMQLWAMTRPPVSAHTQPVAWEGNFTLKREALGGGQKLAGNIVRTYAVHLPGS
jgi:hypothetical protein